MDTQPYSAPHPPASPPQYSAPDASGSTSGLAVVGLILAFLVPIVGLVLSLVALGRTGERKAGGRPLAVIGTIVGGLFTLGGLLLVVVLALGVTAGDGIEREVEAASGVPAPEAGAAPAEGAGENGGDQPADADVPPSESFVDVSTDEWSALVREPAPRVGDLVRFYAEVTQFDTNTGSDLLRANGGATQPSQEFELTDNVILAADAAVFDGLATGDVIRVEAQVQDPVEYDTLIGGATTAPVFTVARVENVGFVDLTADVMLGAYTADEFGGGSIAVSVTNSGPVPYSYSVDIVAVSPDGATQYDTTFASADNLAPGQTATVDASFFDDLPADAVFQVATVDRYDF